MSIEHDTKVVFSSLRAKDWGKEPEREHDAGKLGVRANHSESAAAVTR